MRRDPLVPFRDAGWNACARLGDAECGDGRRFRPRGDERDPGRDAARDLRQQVGPDDQDLRAAVDEDPAGLVRLVVPVDRARVRAQPARGERDLEKRRLVAQHEADDIAFRDAEPLEPARRPLHRVVEGGPADLAFREYERGGHGGRDGAYSSSDEIPLGGEERGHPDEDRRGGAVRPPCDRRR